MEKTIIAYIPVIHRGYLDFFQKHAHSNLFILGKEIIAESKPLTKDVRALSPEEARRIIQDLKVFNWVGIADFGTLAGFQKDKARLIMPDEEFSHELHKKYLNGCKVQYESVFLRWEQGSILKEREIQHERTVPFEGMVEEMMGRALLESHKATNLWRWVGTVIARNKEIILTGYNKQVPNPYTPYYEGDARMFFKKGFYIELTTDHHAEARMIAEAARKGIPLEGSDLFITAFPCPPCAKSVAAAGIRRCYFASGYSILDGERILKDNDVEIIHVQIPGNIV